MTRGSGRYFSEKTICKKINSLSDSGLDKFRNSLMFCFLTATIKHLEFTTAVSFSCSFSESLLLHALQYLEPSITPKQVKQTYNYLLNVLLNYSSDCSVSVLQNNWRNNSLQQEIHVIQTKDFNLFSSCLLTSLEIWTSDPQTADVQVRGEDSCALSIFKLKP